MCVWYTCGGVPLLPVPQAEGAFGAAWAAAAALELGLAGVGTAVFTRLGLPGTLLLGRLQVHHHFLSNPKLLGLRVLGFIHCTG